MYTGTLIEELMATVDRAQSRPAEELVEELQEQRFELWRFVLSEPQIDAQINLAGVA